MARVIHSKEWREMPINQRKHSKIKEFEINDKSTLRLPRHSSFTINHTFVNLGKTGHNMAESLAITTVSTTKAHRG